VFPPTKYLAWARRFYGRVPYDLASSGMTVLPLADLGVPAMREDYTLWDGLRARIGAYNGVPADEAIPALGTSHALWLAYATLLSPGDDLLLESPAYEPMWRIAQGMGVNVVRFERAITDRFALDPARVAAAITPKTRLVAVSSLHNPSGVRASDDALRAVAAIAAAHGAHLLVDEVYAPFDDFVHNGAWAGSARRLAPNVVTTASLTKCYGLGNQRIGWMLGPRHVIAHADDALTANTGHLPLPYASIASYAFDRIDDLAARARALLRGKRALVDAWVAARPRLRWSAPQAGLFGFAVLEGEGDGAGDITERIERGAEQHGVLVAAGAFFGIPNGFRLSWSIDSAKLEPGLDALGRALDL